MGISLTVQSLKRRHAIAKKCARWLVILIACLTGGGAPDVQAQLPFDREYLIKAAFLYNLLKFIEWPADVLSEGARTITMCITGEDPFGDALDPLKGRAVKDKSLEIKRVQALHDLKACHLLFISSSERRRLTEILEAVKGASVLTVAEVERFTARGGIVRLFVERNNVGFEINVQSAERARLKISSRLLNLARVVRG